VTHRSGSEISKPKICIECENTFFSIQKHAQYCSQVCCRNARKLKDNAVCSQCGKNFISYAGKKYCSVDCSRAAFARAKRICLNCGVEYKPKQVDRVKFCSRGCSFEYKKKIAEPKKAIKVLARNRVCLICGNNYMGNPASKCCSDDCRRKYANNNAKVRASSTYSSTTFKCKWCGSDYTTKYGDRGKRSFCSDICLHRHGSKTNKYKRRLKTKQTKQESFSIRSVYERDRWVCQICGKKVNKNRLYPDRMCASLDHIIPLSKGGPHTYNNVQLAHLACNVSKSNKLPESIQLRMELA
jgi:hypothetical protein